MKVLIWLLVITFICFVVYLIIRHNLKHKTETITAFTGGLGAGKSLMSVQIAIKLYFKQVRRWKLRKRLNSLYNFFVFWKKKEFNDEKPILLSNIPIKIKNHVFNHAKDVYSYQLTEQHLLLQEKIPLHSVVFIDEIGSFMSQFDFNQQNVIKVCDEFVRFFRHYTKNGYMVVNDQCSENINLVIRRRLNTIHNLSNCFVIGPFAFYFERMINISEEIKTIDNTSNGSNKNDTQDNMNLRFAILWHKKAYDSHCYSERYNSVPLKEFIRHKQLKTNRLLKCPKDKEKLYKPLTSGEDN